MDKEEISTLHYVLADNNALMAKYGLSPKVAHLSTAMANYAYGKRDMIICFVEQRTMHFCIMDKGGFLYYNQYDCYYEYDSLYFINLMIDTFFNGDKSTVIHLSGSIWIKDEMFRTLRKYMPRLKFIDGNLRLSEDTRKSPSLYYDLHLCRTCVS